MSFINVFRLLLYYYDLFVYSLCMLKYQIFSNLPFIINVHYISIQYRNVFLEANVYMYQIIFAMLSPN